MVSGNAGLLLNGRTLAETNSLSFSRFCCPNSILDWLSVSVLPNSPLVIPWSSSSGNDAQVHWPRAPCIGQCYKRSLSFSIICKHNKNKKLFYFISHQEKTGINACSELDKPHQYTSQRQYVVFYVLLLIVVQLIYHEQKILWTWKNIQELVRWSHLINRWPIIFSWIRTPWNIIHTLSMPKSSGWFIRGCCNTVHYCFLFVLLLVSLWQ